MVPERLLLEYDSRELPRPLVLRLSGGGELFPANAANPGSAVRPRPKNTYLVRRMRLYRKAGRTSAVVRSLLNQGEQHAIEKKK